MNRMKIVDSFTGDYACFSNFYKMVVPCNVRRERFFYVENAYQALKARDTTEFREIITAPTPDEAKRLGRKVKMNTANWDLIKPGVMYMLVELKFFSNPGFGEILKSTGSAYLLNDSTWHDNYWGDCQCVNPDCAGKGKNMLGKILMRVRRELQTYYPSA